MNVTPSSASRRDIVRSLIPSFEATTCACLAMGKQRGDCILDRDPERAGVARASVQALFADLEQDFAQARVGVDHRPLRRAGRENYLVGVAAKFDVFPEETSKFRNSL